MTQWSVTRTLLSSLALVVCLFGFLAGCGSIEDDKTGGGAPRASSNAVTISDFKFRPQTLEVSKGTRVTWTNKDKDQHSITADNGDFDKTLNAGQSFSYTFEESGTFTYHCRLFNNPGLKGKVIVK